MSRFFVMAAALALVLGGCGKKEEQPKMEQAEAPAMETPSAPSEEAMAPAEGDAMTGDAMGTSQGMADQAGTMADEAATAAEGMAASAESMGQEAAAGAEQAAQEMTAAADQAMAKAAAPAADRGKQVYDMVCFACHADGIAGAPKLGDKALWGPRIAQGMDTLVNHAINGFQGSTGVMPPKGGRMDLSDEDIKAAVSYMVDQAK